MTLTINSQETEQRELAVTVEVAESRVQKAMKKTARKYARDLRIPGFRKGKAPYHIVRGIVGAEALRGEAVNEILPKIWEEALSQVDQQPYAQPTLDDIDMDPLVIKITVPVEPATELGEYRDMRQEVAEVAVTEEAIDEAITTTQQQQTTTETVERAAAMGDVVIVTGGGAAGEGEEASTAWIGEGQEVVLQDGEVFPGTSFVSELVGLSAGDEKAFSITFADDYDDAGVAGKTVNFTVVVDEVKERSVPALDDEFAKAQAGDFETFDAYRASIGDNLQKQAEEQAVNDRIEGFIDVLTENVEEMVYSPAVLSSEIDGMVNEIKNQVQQIGMTWEDYIGYREDGEEGLREEFEADAVTRLERRLVFQKFLEAENLLVTADEIRAAVDERLESYDEEMREYMRPFLEGDGIQMITQPIIMDKADSRIVAIYRGEAPSLEELAAAAEAAANTDADDAAEEAEDSAEVEVSAEAEADTPAEDAAPESED